MSIDEVIKKSALGLDLKQKDIDSLLKFLDEYNKNIIKKHKKNQIIYTDNTSKLNFVFEGALLEKVCLEIPRRDICIHQDLIRRDEVFGNLFFDHFDAYWVVLEDSKILTLTKEQRNNLIRKVPEVGVNLVRLQDEVAKRYRFIGIMRNNQFSLKERIDYALDFVFMQAGTNRKGNYFEVRNLYRSDIAKFLGSAPESISRHLSANKGEVLRKRKTFRLKKNFHVRLKKNGYYTG